MRATSNGRLHLTKGKLPAAAAKSRGRQRTAGEAEITKLVNSVRRANVVLDAGSLAAQNRLQISRTALSALEWLTTQGPMLVGDIAAELGISTGTASEAVDRLAARELVSRAADPEDRRRTRVSVTAKGRREFNSAFRERWQWIREMGSQMSATEVRCVIRFLERLHEIMPDHWRADAPSIPAGTFS